MSSASSSQRGLEFAIVELHSEPLDTLRRSGLVAKVGPDMIFDDLEDAVSAFSASEAAGTARLLTLTPMRK